MKDEREEANRFSDDLDRLLSGGEIGTERDENTRRTLEFAQKMQSLRPEPSARFQSQLKQQLLTRIAKQERAGVPERGWLANLIRQPIWQTITAVLVVAIVVGAMWGAGIFRSPTETESISSPRVAMTSVPSPTSTGTTIPETSSAPLMAASPPAATVQTPTATTEQAAGAIPAITPNSVPSPVFSLPQPPTTTVTIAQPAASQTVPTWIWFITAIGAVLIIVVITLIIRIRRRI